jgi:superfamily II DNA or RNA helicase
MACVVEKKILKSLKNPLDFKKNALYTFVRNKKEHVKIYCHLEINGDNVYIPLGLIQKTKELQNYLPPLNLNVVDYSSLFELRQEQKMWLDQVLKNSPCSFSQAWSLNPGFGKTIVGLCAAVYYNLPTIIIVPRSLLKKQWQDVIDQKQLKNIQVEMLSFIPKIQIKNFLLIMDEAHLCITKKTFKEINKLEPSILIGLSGTFYRHDELHPYLEWFFGPKIELNKNAFNVLQNSISRKITCDIYYTKFEPELISRCGKLDWDKVLKSIFQNEERNQLIAKLVNNLPDQNILILVKYIEHGKLLANLIPDSCTCFNNEEIKASRIIISTCKKMGVGVSLNHLNCIVLASDLVNYSIQYISRVLRDKTQDAYIIDFVDNHPIFFRHFYERKKIYSELNSNVNKIYL